MSVAVKNISAMPSTYYTILHVDGLFFDHSLEKLQEGCLLSSHSASKNQLFYSKILFRCSYVKMNKNTPIIRRYEQKPFY